MIIRFLIAFFLSCSVALAGIGIGVTPFPGPGVVVSGGGDGPNIWYYAGGLSSGAFTTEEWIDNERLVGGKIIIGAAGSLTKMTFKSVQARGGTHTLVLTDVDGVRLACKTIVNSGVGWLEVTLDTPVTVTSSQIVYAYVIQSVGGDISFGTYSIPSTGNGKYSGNYSGASICSTSPITADTADSAFAVGVYVD